MPLNIDYLLEEDFVGVIETDNGLIVPERKRRRCNSVTAPKVLVFKNDIRRFYASMFINALNSGDFDNIQNYLNTFVAPICNFVSDNQTAIAFGLPLPSVVTGPRLMAHYLLGCFVMSPDLVVSLLSNRIVTFSGQQGSHIVLEVEYKCTKIQDLTLQQWVPQQDSLLGLYRAYSNNLVRFPSAATGGNSLKAKSSVRKFHVISNREAPLCSFPVIPERCIANLHEVAQLCTPQAFQQRAVVTLVLDSDNHMQKIYVVHTPTMSAV